MRFRIIVYTHVTMATGSIYIYIYEHEAIQKPISENNIGAPKIVIYSNAHIQIIQMQ